MLTDDGFAELGGAERSGTLAFAAAPQRLLRARSVAFAVMVAAAAVTAFAASRIYAVDLGREPPDHGETAIVAALGALLVLLSLRILSFLSHRLADIELTAPLVLRPGEVVAGAPPRTIAFAQICAIEPAPPAGRVAGFVQATYDRIVYLCGRSRTAIVRLTCADAEPLILDLDLVDGEPRRIERILSFRIAQAKT
jgi:hypothetical protein